MVGSALEASFLELIGSGQAGDAAAYDGDALHGGG